MPLENNATPVNNYDPRWFIWTIVFLVSTGIMLVTYIVASDTSNETPGVYSARASNSKP